jgi:hypothetical protein
MTTDLPRMDSAPSGALEARRRSPLLPDGDAGEDPLLRMAIAAWAIEQDDLARALLDQHRREFPTGRLARDRDRLLRRWARVASRQ